MTLRLLLILLALAVFWGSAFPGIKFGLESFSAGHLTLLRHLVASLCFLPVLIAMKLRLFPKWKDVSFFFLLGVLGYTIYHTALNYGELRVSAGAASLIISTAPAFTAIVAFFLLKERLSVGAWFGILLSFIGVLLIVTGEDNTFGLNLYALLILLSSVVAAFYAVLQKPILQRYTAVQVTAFATWAGTLPMLVFFPGFVLALQEASRVSLVASVYIGVVPSAIAYTLFSYAIAQAPVTLVSAFIYLVPVFSILFSWLLLSEIPSWLSIIGGVVIIFGIMLVNSSKQRLEYQKGK